MKMRWLLPFLAFASVVVTPFPTQAGTQTFTSTHTYVLGDDDSRNTARQKCLAEAKRKILEQVGVYLESHSELLTSAQSTAAGSVKSPQTTNEERQQITEKITTLTAGLMRAEVIKEEFGEVNGRLRITLTIKADVDPDDIQKQLAARRVDQGVRKQVTEQEQRLAQLEEQLRTMLEEMRTVGGSQPRGSEQQEKNPVVPDVAEIRPRANKGDAEAQSTLGIMYQLGRGVPQSDTEAVAWYRKAAEQGNAPGQHNLGWMYLNGRGVPQSDTEAVAWYRKAAEQGNASGQINLGWMYEMGRGMPQDDAQAVAWYRKAAEQGHAPGQASLGVMYMDGRGVPQNDTEAVKWYRKAAEQGNGMGQNNLGRMYKNGRGVSQDSLKAHMWGSLAVVNGGTRARALRDEVAKQMTPSQISEAQAMAQRCHASNYKNCD